MIRNQIFSIVCLVFSGIVYFFNGWHPATIYFLITAIIFTYWSVDKVKKVYNYYGKDNED